MDAIGYLPSQLPAYILSVVLAWPFGPPSLAAVNSTWKDRVQMFQATTTRSRVHRRQPSPVRHLLSLVSGRVP
ncbi:hypothetical protein C8J57DRAFT_1407286 [Mycena rebaudengoi]|nr:hypothetical protein C8J57DRAFT_1407286 [Mycena rebaudengoi]